MGFVQVIRSIEDLLFEIMTWLVFYPRTLWQVIRQPMKLARYSDDEQDDAPVDQYSDTLSPPIFLMLTILIAHGIELAAGQRLVVAQDSIASMAAESHEVLLLLRSVLFAVYPVFFSATLLRLKRVPLDRKVLREPFFSQCYLASFFALLASLAGILAKLSLPFAQPAAAAIAVGAVIWFIAVEAAWFRAELGAAWGRATWTAVATFLKASAVNLAIAIAMVA